MKFENYIEHYYFCKSKFSEQALITSYMSLKLKIDFFAILTFCLSQFIFNKENAGEQLN